MSDFVLQRDTNGRQQIPGDFFEEKFQNVRLAPRQPLYHEGDGPESFYRVQRGLIRLMRIKPDGRSVTLRHVLPGDLFGEEIFIGAKRFADAEAATEAVVEVFDARDLRGPNVLGVVHSLVTQTKRLLNDEYDFQVGYLRERIARYLCKLIKTPLAERAEDGSWRICASHELIAEGTASTRESVSKELADMRHDSIIDTGYRSISITDLRALRRLGDPEGALVGSPGQA
ncbi:MAG: cyclic nucleotide-binding domain-containing protein [Trueperaceae bacterium]